MNKRGFTLIELIAVIGLLALLALASYPNITSQLKKSRQTNYNVFEQNIFLATETYINTYREQYVDFKNAGDVVRIELKELIESGYVKSTIVNPKTNEKISETDYVEVTINSDLTYNYTYNY